MGCGASTPVEEHKKPEEHKDKKPAAAPKKAGGFGAALAKGLVKAAMKGDKGDDGEDNGNGDNGDNGGGDE